MIFILFHFISFYSNFSTLIFDFQKGSDISEWYVVNDGVMGGRSKGTFTLSPEGYGVFTGSISLENNGGFSSIRHQFNPFSCENYSRIEIRVKGDGKKYQFRIKENSRDFASYITYFSTSGEWEIISIKLADLYPSFRGRILNRPNFEGKLIEEIGILFGNKKKGELQT